MTVVVIRGFDLPVQRALHHAALIKTKGVRVDAHDKPQFIHGHVELIDPLAALLYLEDKFPGAPLFGFGDDVFATKARFTQVVNRIFTGQLGLDRLQEVVALVRRRSVFIGEGRPCVLDLVIEPLVCRADYTDDVERAVMASHWGMGRT